MNAIPVPASIVEGSFAHSVKAKFEEHGVKWRVGFEELPPDASLPQAMGASGGSEYYFYVEVSELGERRERHLLP
jgi:hypothetical protein